MSAAAIELHDGVVVLDYERLVDPAADYVDAIEQAFGCGDACLGVLLVKNVPGLAPKRERLLDLASHLGNLPEAELAKARDPVTEWIGWDRGTEIFNGKRDLAKGSFYANPLCDDPAAALAHDPQLRDAFPEMTRPNRWLPESLPQLEPAFKDLARLIVGVGALVARQCDKYAAARGIATYPGPEYLHRVVTQSRAHKARLLHYYPLNSLPGYTAAAAAAAAAEKPKSAAAKSGGAVQDDLCGWHLDNSSITGLTSAIYVRESRDAATGALALERVPAPADAGLFIRTRGGALVRAGIPAACLAFQIGEALERSTQGMLRATSHCVFGGAQADLARNTLAVFCQPDLADRVTPDLSFAQFCRQVYAANHADVPDDAASAAHAAPAHASTAAAQVEAARAS